MRNRIGFFGIGLITTLTLWSSESFSQVQAAQNRIPQQIVVNGQTATGAYVTTPEGQLQSYTCPSPQRYTTADGSAQGWACYEQTTGVWLLSAVPPAQPQAAPAPQPVAPQPPIVYPQAPPAVVYQQTPPTVVYQQAPPAVIYQPAPQPTVIYQQPAAVVYSQPGPVVVYAPAPRPIVVAPVYPASVILGSAAINAAGRVAAAAISNSHYPRDYDYDHHHDRNRGRRWY
jgi:hypothetical protein